MVFGSSRCLLKTDGKTRWYDGGRKLIATVNLTQPVSNKVVQRLGLYLDIRTDRFHFTSTTKHFHEASRQLRPAVIGIDRQRKHVPGTYRLTVRSNNVTQHVP